jgi:hypothetical protein
MPDLTQEELHSRGAIKRHHSPFAQLVVPVNTEPLAEAFAAKWVHPFYLLNLWMDSAQFISALRPVLAEISTEVISTLLDQLDWRPRLVGGYFVAIKKQSRFEDQIGSLLLRSDVCYAALGYSLALARLNSRISIRYLYSYLEYYLTRHDLWFDQSIVMAALGYVDATNQTHLVDDLMPLWNQFLRARPGWNVSHTDDFFATSMRVIEEAANS